MNFVDPRLHSELNSQLKESIDADVSAIGGGDLVRLEIGKDVPNPLDILRIFLVVHAIPLHDLLWSFGLPQPLHVQIVGLTYGLVSHSHDPGLASALLNHRSRKLL